MRSLRQQIYEIAARMGESILAKNVSFPTLCDQLALKMFREQEPESADTIAVRRCLKLFYSPGYVSEEEPEVKS